MADDLSRGAGEVQREGRHIAAEVVDIEYELFGKIGDLSPHYPAHTEGGQPELVTGGVDRFYTLDAEVPYKVTVDEGGDESAAGAVDVDGDVKPRLLLEFVERLRHLLDRFVLQREGQSKRGDDADGVFVDILADLFRSHAVFAGLHRDLAVFDIPVAGELVPADLYRAGDDVRLVCRFALGLALFAPAPEGREAAEHRRFRRTGGRGADCVGLLRRIPQVAEHTDAARLELRRLRVFVFIDHILVDTLVHQLMRLFIEPGLAECGKVLRGVAVEDELVVDCLICVLRLHLRLGERVFRQQAGHGRRAECRVDLSVFVFLLVK
ncbi:hypothetical protein SDC9_91952 [bioreactor metagenome]|uniref:Uncharacterized protein n=1 Tax=bioreactor metagenome TaxID=1076179 RepID=A0A644ZX23_9ZZZZ